MLVMGGGFGVNDIQVFLSSWDIYDRCLYRGDIFDALCSELQTLTVAVPKRDSCKIS
eukprot:m.274507 g.274507  ORF g.274507 m.274507 type:complete len:57 (-) comp49388_c0_seq1:9-179(-)